MGLQLGRMGLGWRVSLWDTPVDGVGQGALRRVTRICKSETSRAMLATVCIDGL